MSITEEDINTAVEDGGRYSLKKFLTSSPATLKKWLMTVIGAVIVIKHIDIAPESLAIGGLALEATLDQFYVKPIEAHQAEVQVLKGIDLGQQTARTRPLRASKPA